MEGEIKKSCSGVDLKTGTQQSIAHTGEDEATADELDEDSSLERNVDEEDFAHA